MNFDDPVTTNDGALIKTAIRSPNYVTGVTGWSINADGTAEFSDVTTRGELWVVGDNGTYLHAVNDAGQPWLYLHAGLSSYSPGGIRAYVDSSTGVAVPTTELASPRKTATSAQATLRAHSASNPGAGQPGLQASHGLTVDQGDVTLSAGGVTATGDARISGDVYAGPIQANDIGRGVVIAEYDVRSAVINTTETPLFIGSSFPVSPGRAYEVDWSAGDVYASTTGGICQIRIRKNVIGGTVIVDHRLPIQAGVGNQVTQQGRELWQVSAAGTMNLFMTGFTLASSSTADGLNAGHPRRMIVRDVGPSAAFTGLPTITIP